MFLDATLKAWVLNRRAAEHPPLTRALSVTAGPREPDSFVGHGVEDSQGRRAECCVKLATMNSIGGLLAYISGGFFIVVLLMGGWLVGRW
jgi:hypothetical protein